MMKILLSGKRGAGKYALVDDEDYELVTSKTWHLNADGYAIWRGWVETTQEARAAGRETPMKLTLFMHRLVMGVGVGGSYCPSEQVDHIDQNKLNNQKSNLRVGSRLENAQNIKSHRDAETSQYRGVYFNKRSSKWYARAQANGKFIWLGSHDTEVDAAEAVASWWSKQ